MNTELRNKLMAKYNVTDEKFAEFLIKTYGGMCHTYLERADWGTWVNNRPPTQEEKARLWTESDNNHNKLAAEYTIRMSFPHLLHLLEE